MKNAQFLNFREKGKIYLSLNFRRRSWLAADDVVFPFKGSKASSDLPKKNPLQTHECSKYAQNFEPRLALTSVSLIRSRLPTVLFLLLLRCT